MLEEALAEDNNTGANLMNPAMSNAPTVLTEPEINGVPEINYMPMPGDEVLPPPPAPPIELNDNATEPSLNPTTITLPPVSNPVEPMPEVESTPTSAPEPAPTTLGSQPAMQDQIYAPQASNPSAFRIPGIQ